MRWPWSRHAAELSAEEMRSYQHHARPAARLVHSDISGRGGRLGGRPVLSTTDWPSWDDRPLSFLACLDLDDLATTDVDLALPTSGTLSFFYEAQEQQAWGFDPEHRDGWRVIFTPAGEGQTLDPPDGAVTFAEVPLVAEAVRTFPDPEEPAVSGLRAANRKGLYASAQALQAGPEGRSAWSHAVQHQVGGWPILQQGVLWDEAQLASNGISVGGPSGYRDRRAADLLQASGDWKLLLQLDSDDRAGWMWGDVGMLYFLIRRQDLAAQRFENTWTILQCA